MNWPPGAQKPSSFLSFSSPPNPPALQILFLTLEPNSAAKVKPDDTAVPGRTALKHLAASATDQGHLDNAFAYLPNSHQTSLVP